jgi:type III restriction enzyme
MFELKRYQNDTIQALASYLRMAREMGAGPAYDKYMNDNGITCAQYDTHDLGDIPYVCLRLPTGGGKTVLASYGIREAAFYYMNKQNPLVLWLVPTITIAEQTFACLIQPNHPYRQAIDEYFGGRVSVYAISDVNNIRPQDFENKVCIVIGTMASLRVRDRTGRKIYDHNENYQPHFERLIHKPDNMDIIEEGPDTGKVKYSFVNLCHIHRPLVILDEAHNARTILSFETLKRLNPACIIEFTATPNLTTVNGSNVLHSVSALELKYDVMIKLPIVLTEHNIWQEAIAEAILTRRRLQALADAENTYIRPIVLFQAENKDKEVTVEVLKRYLVENESIAEDSIAIATGEIKGLKDMDLFARDCKIEYIITVEALKEGWDCSFAYVFCSVANVRSSTAVEQLLGRVLRMPYAKRSKTTELNMAYAHVVSPSFSAAAQDLKDALVNKMGFEKLETDTYVRSGSNPEDEIQISLFPKEKETITVTGFDIDTLDLFIQGKLSIDEQEGLVQIQLIEYINDTELDEIIKAVPDEQKARVRQILNKERIARSIEPQIQSEKKTGFSIPRLVFVDSNEIIDLLDDDSMIDAADWNILDYSHEMPYFRISSSGNTFEIDISETNKIVWSSDEYSELKNELLIKLPDLNELDLINWLDKEIRRIDIPQQKNLIFIYKAVEYLKEKKQYSLEQLFMAKFQLALALKELVKSHILTAKEKGFQSLIIDQEDSLRVDSSYGFVFETGLAAYPVSPPYYHGSYVFKKHLYEIIAGMNEEEIKCAEELDRHPLVKTWVRNLERKPSSSFWLPTSTDRFYPDFVAELTDGRLLVVEYKGQDRADSKDTQEKTFIGELWAKHSNGKAVFLMAFKKDRSGMDLKRQLEESL